MDIISAETLIPISFVLALIGGIVYNERRLASMKTTITELRLLFEGQQKQIEEMKKSFIPSEIVNLKLEAIQEDVKEIKEKLK